MTSLSPLGTTVTPYDTLVVAAGAGQSYFGNDQFSEFAPGMKSIDDALELRGRIFGSFELAELCTDPAEAEEWLTFVVVGAGPTGVEMAGQIAELAHRTLRRDFRRIDTTRARVILLDAAPAVLGAFGEKLSRGGPGPADQDRRRGPAQRQGRRRGQHRRRRRSTRTAPSAGSRSRCKVWAAGVSASPLGQQLAEQSDAEVDRAGRVKVNPDLSLPGHPEVFVIGDMIALNNLPGVAQVAMQGGKHVAGQIKRRLAGQRTGQPFKYFDKGSMATISRFSAVAAIGEQDQVLRLHRLADVAGRARDVPDRLQEPLHHDGALGGQLPVPRPVPADHHPAADRRPDPAGPAEPGRGGAQATYAATANGDRPTPEEAQDLEGGVVVAESADPKAHPA